MKDFNNSVSGLIKSEAAAVDGFLCHLGACLLLLQQDMFGKLPDRSLAPHTVAYVLGGIACDHGGALRDSAQTRQVQTHDVLFIVT